MDGWFKPTWALSDGTRFLPPCQMFQRGELPVPEAAGGIPGGSAARRPPDLSVWSRPSSGPSRPRVWRSPWRSALPWAADRLLLVSRCQHGCTGDGGRRWVKDISKFSSFVPLVSQIGVIMLSLVFCQPSLSSDVRRRGSHFGRLWGPTAGGGAKPREGGASGGHGCSSRERTGNHQHYGLHRHHRYCT